MKLKTHRSTFKTYLSYPYFYKFSDRHHHHHHHHHDRSLQIDQTATRSSLIRVYTVCYSICIFWRHFLTAKPIILNNRVIKALSRVSVNLDFYGKFYQLTDSGFLMKSFIFALCHSVCIFWWHFFIVRPICLNFSVITTIS